MATVSHECAYCGTLSEHQAGKVNRAKKMGLNLYCGRKCSGLGRRTGKTIDQLKAEKAEYDKIYRDKNQDRIKKAKKEYFKKVYVENPDKFKEERIRKYPAHKEYIKSPKYRKWKKQYDKRYLSKKNFGEFWESALILNDIESIIPNREVKQENGLINKSIKRKRDYEKTKCKKPERIPMGNLK